MPERQPGELDTNLTRRLHEWCLLESGMYRVAHSHGLVGLMAALQLKFLDEFLRVQP